MDRDSARRPGDPSTQQGPSDDRERARAVTLAFFQAVARGDLAAALSVCTGDGRWWLPIGADEHRPVRDAAQGLLEFVGPGRFSDGITIVASGSGELAVVEQQVVAPGSHAPSTVTSVVEIRNGLVASGRTYADVAAWSRPAADAVGESGSR